MAWRNFVAVGDSFTEGLNDRHPDGGRFRGWADRVAARLAIEVAAEGGGAKSRASSGRASSGGASSGRARRGVPPAGSAEPFRYANLAVRGRLFASIVDEQLPAALEMRPDLVSFAAGGNDALRPSFDPVALLTRFDEAIGSIRGAGADAIVFRFPDISRRLPVKNMLLPRMAATNEALGDIARRHGAYLVDLWSDDEFGNPRLWSEDRLHLSRLGHRRVAAHVLRTLGVTPDPVWLRAPQRPIPPSWPLAVAEDALWAAQYLAPWIRRRLTGRSSGDHVLPKRPELAPLTD